MPNSFGNKRTTEDGKINSILIIDNEHENVGDLEIALRKAAMKTFAEGEKVIYTASPDEAVRDMLEKLKNGGGYSAIITDNHFDMDDGVFTIDGQDFIRIFYGGLGYCISHADEDMNIGNFRRFKSFGKLVEEVIGKSSRPRSAHVRNVVDFMERNFGNPNTYQSFLDYYTGRVDKPFVLLYCGNPRFVDKTGLDGIDVVHKRQEDSELKIIETLREEGIIPEEEITHALEEHPRFGDYLDKNSCKGYNPRASHIRRLLGKGRRFSSAPFK